MEIPSNLMAGGHTGPPLQPQRKPIRLKDFDYSESGWYYVTICVQGHACLFGDIVNGEMTLNNAGEMVGRWWLKIPERFKDVKLDLYQIMPSHLHGIIIVIKRYKPMQLRDIVGNVVGADPCVGPCGRSQQTLFKVIQWFKTMTTNEYIRNVKTNGWKPFNKHLWQRNYYEHIIRNEKDLYKKQRYIATNPLTWYKDDYNPINL